MGNAAIGSSRITQFLKERRRAGALEQEPPGGSANQLIEHILDWRCALARPSDGGFDHFAFKLLGELESGTRTPVLEYGLYGKNEIALPKGAFWQRLDAKRALITDGWHTGGGNPEQPQSRLTRGL